MKKIRKETLKKIFEHRAEGKYETPNYRYFCYPWEQFENKYFYICRTPNPHDENTWYNESTLIAITQDGENFTMIP